MALPFQLDHINLWLIEDGDGWLQVDSGLGNEPTRLLWEKIIADKIGAKPVRRVLVTHYHPDHAGNAAWLCNRFAAPLLMTRGEFLTVHAARNSTAGYTTEAQLELFRANGLDDASGAELLLRGGLYRSMVPDFPVSHRRLFEGECVVAGGREWKVILGYGHAPEHVSRARLPALRGAQCAGFGRHAAAAHFNQRCRAAHRSAFESAAPVPGIDPALPRTSRRPAGAAFARPAVPRRARAHRAARGAPY